MELHTLQQFIEQMPVAIAIFDGELRYLAVSHRQLSNLAWLFSTEVLAPEKVIGRTFFEVSPKAPSRWGDGLARVLAGEELAQEEDFVPRRDGRAVWVRWVVKPWRNAHGRIGGALLFSELITEQVEIRHALHESESRARATFENAAMGISHVTPDGKFLRFNKALSRILGWPADELITKLVPDITHPDDLAVELAHLKQLEDGKVDSFTVEKRDLRKDGTVVWVRRTVSSVRRSDGSIDYFVSVLEDISARKRAEEQVHESEALFRNTFENAAVGIAHLSPDLRWLRANEALCRILGWPINELVTKSLQDISHPTDFEAELAHIQQMLAGEIENYAMEKRYLLKNLGFVWTRLTVSCVRKSDRSIDYFVGVVEDISARKRAEELLQRQADLLDQSNDAIFTWKIGGCITYWNRGAEMLYGYSREEAIGRVSHELLRTRAQISMQDVEAQISRDGSWQGELTHTRRDGQEIVVESRHVRVAYDGELYALETNRDITARKRAEEQIHLLMREARHRVGNLLGLVQAIARQTADASSEAFVGRFTERIQALAASQDLLNRNQQRGADLETVVRAQLAHFSDLIGSRIEVLGPRLRLNATAAQAIGLAVHELATNAGKYGALSTERGRVDIGWAMTDDTFTMSWTERKGPPVRPPERKGFGSTVIDSMAGRALSGEVQLDYAPLGLGWRLTCPGANALEGTAKPVSKPSDAPANPSPRRKSRRSSASW